MKIVRFDFDGSLEHLLSLAQLFSEIQKLAELDVEARDTDKSSSASTELDDIIGHRKKKKPTAD